MRAKVMTMKEKLVGLTAVFEKVPEGYIAFVEEIPGVNTQGATMEETRENLNEALRLVIETNREMVEKEHAGHDVVKERLSIEL